MKTTCPYTACVLFATFLAGCSPQDAQVDETLIPNKNKRTSEDASSSERQPIVPLEPFTADERLSGDARDGEDDQVGAKRSNSGIDFFGHATTAQEAPVVEPEFVASLEWKGAIKGKHFTPDGARLYAIDIELGLVSHETKNQQTSNGRHIWPRVATWKWHQKPIERMVLSRDGRVLVTADQRRIAVWDTATASVMTTYTHPDAEKLDEFDDIIALGISPDGASIVSSDATCFDYFAWDARTGQELWRKRTRWRDVKPIDFDSHGKTVVLWGDQALLFCDTRTGKEQRRVPIATDSLSEVLHSPDGTRVLIAEGEETKGQCLGLLSNPDGKLLWAVETGFTWLEGMTFSPDGARIVVVGQEGWPGQRIVQFWDVDEGHLQFTFKASGFSDGSPVFSPDGTLIIIGHDVWKTPTRSREQQGQE